MTLTEQWKNGELPRGQYWVKEKGGKIAEWEIGGEGIIIETKPKIDEVLAPVPSYEEWQKLKLHDEKATIKLGEVYIENQQLKAQIAKLTEIIGVLPSNHSVGNLGYKIKNQRHEINNRLKEIDKLKELLKRCRDFINYEVPDHCIDDVLLDKIDNAIGEKK